MAESNRDFRAILAGRMDQDRDRFFGTSRDMPQLIEVDLDRLKPNPDQPRQEFDEEALQELADSIEEYGLLQPIVIERDLEEEDGYVIVSGERRWRAHRLLGRDTIFALLTAGDRRVKAIVENLQREDLRPIELAQSLAELKTASEFSDEELGKTIGKKRVFVTEVLRLNTLPEEIRRECRTSDIAKSTLLELARLEDPEEQRRRWTQVRDGGATVREMREVKQAAKRGDRDSDVPTAEAKALAAGRSFVRKLQALALDPEEDTEFFLQLKELQRQIDEILGDDVTP
jgi:ParB family transcriptional regulator, chromosome partitioning protein